MLNDLDINDEVFVKLTDYGKQYLRDKGLYFGLREREGGYYKEQLNFLMYHFGKDFKLGNGNIPFETTIKLKI